MPSFFSPKPAQTLIYPITYHLAKRLYTLWKPSVRLQSIDLNSKVTTKEYHCPTIPSPAVDNPTI